MFLTLWSSRSVTDSHPAPSSTPPCGPRLESAAGCFGKCKSSILSSFSQGNPAGGEAQFPITVNHALTRALVQNLAYSSNQGIGTSVQRPESNIIELADGSR